MNRREFMIASAATGLAGTPWLSGAAFAQQQTTISIATGGTGGVYYPLGGGMANLLSKALPGYVASARVTGGSVANCQLVGSKQAEMALSQVDAAYDAIKGIEKFTSGALPIRKLMVLYPNRMHVVSVEGRGVTKMADLKGKRVSTGSPGSATEVFAFRCIEMAGLDKDKDMRRERLGVAESTNAVKDGKIDAYFWVGGLPTAAVTDLGATPNTKIVMIDTADLVPKMNAKYYDLYTTDTIKAKTYPGQDKDNPVAVIQNILIAHESMPDQTAYDIVKTFMEKQADLVAVHSEAQSITIANQKNGPIQWHPGALKYMKEKGAKVG